MKTSLKGTIEINLELDGEKYSVYFEKDGEIAKIIFYSFFLDEWVDATEQFQKYESLTEPAFAKVKEHPEYLAHQEYEAEEAAALLEYDMTVEKYFGGRDESREENF